jgi:hypothetical protein
MSRGFFIDIQGLQPLLADLKKKGKDMEDTVAAEIAATAVNIERKAAQRVPKDAGFLSGAIKSQAVNTFNWEVVAQRKYAPYIEFGTGALVEVPKGLESYAIQFKGKGIKKVNIPARPYLFPSYFEETRELVKRLKAEINQKLR